MRARIVLLLLSIAAVVDAQTPPNPLIKPPPDAIFDLALGDADVSFFATGTWESAAAAAFGWYIHGPDALEFEPGYIFPGLEAIGFTNTPNFTLSLWLLQRYFFETTIASSDFSGSTILFGYTGQADESVQSVLVGNSAIEIGEYPYLGFGDSNGVAGQDAPGASATFETPSSRHELMLRFAPAEEATIDYANGGVVTETTTDAGDYLPDTDFVLPDANVNALEIYVADPNGDSVGSDGVRYRSMDIGTETATSLTDGTVAFLTAPTTRVLVYYEVGGAAIGSSTALGRDSFFGMDAYGHPDPAASRDFSFGELQTNFDGLFGDLFGDGSVGGSPDTEHDLSVADFRVTVNGHDSLVLYQPGRYSPFALANRYAVDVPTGASVLVETASGSSISGLYTHVPLNRAVVAVDAGSGNARDFASRYPFASDTASEQFPSIYGPGRHVTSGTPSIVVRTTTKSSVITLPSGFIPGSVRIERNGVGETGFVVADDGTITFDTPLEATERVHVAYRTSDLAEGGDLLFASGNTFNIVPGLEAQVALGARWKPPAQRYSTVADEYPGSVTLSGLVSGDAVESGLLESGDLRAEVKGAVSYSSSDTSGVLRLAGMDEASRSIPITPLGMFPAPAPAAVPPTDTPVGTESDYAAANRGELTYTDYYSFSGGDRVLNAYSTDSSSFMTYAYASGGRTGPYPARSYDDDYSGVVAVFDYSLADGATWTGGIVRIDGGAATDLSDARTLIVPYRVLSATGPAHLILEVGAIGEDLDSDGTIDAGTSLSFRDQHAAVTLNAGTLASPGTDLTEDANDNGMLDPELPDQIFAYELESALNSAPTAWQHAAIELTANQARLLRDSTAVRVIMVDDTPTAQSGRVLLGQITVSGSSFAVAYPDSPRPDVIVRELPESAAPLTSNVETLASAFPEAGARFGQTGVTGSILSVAWSGLGAGGAITLTRAAEVPAADYGTLRIYARSADGTTPQITLRARGDAQTIAENQVQLASSGWQQIDVTMPADSTDVIRAVDVVVAGEASAEVYFDELSLWDPRSRLGAIGELQLTYAPDLELTLGSVPLLSGLTLTEHLTAQTATFPDAIASTRSGIESESTLAARILGIATAGSFTIVGNQAGIGMQGKHSLGVTLAGIALKDTFRSSYGTLGKESVHLSSVGVPFGGAGSLALEWKRDADETTATQWSVQATSTSGAADNEPSAVSFGGRLALSLEETTLAGATELAYPVEWATSYVGVIPGVSPQDRTMDASLALTADRPAAGVHISASAGTGASAEDGTRSVETKLKLEVPIRIGKDVGLTLTAARAATQSIIGVPLETPGDDAASAVSLIASHPIGWTFWPLWELVDPLYLDQSSALTDGVLEVSYSPSIGATIRRSISSSPWSLVIPATSSVSVARTFERDSDSTRALYDIALSGSFIAPNLFGRLGTTPVFDFYDTDEYQATVQVTITGGSGAQWSEEIKAQQKSRIHWQTGASVELDSTVSATLPDHDSTDVSTRLAYTVSTTPAFLELIPVPTFFAGSDRSLDHETALELEYSAADDDRLLARITHTATLDFGGSGLIELNGGIGLGTALTASEPTFYLGLRLGIAGTLRL